MFSSRLRAAASTTGRRLLTRPLSAKPHPYESFLSGTSSNYVDDMYHAWKASPAAVHASWDAVFKRMEADARPGQTFVPPPGIHAGETLAAAKAPPATRVGTVAAAAAEETAEDYMKVMQLVHAYQARGHNVCDLDPLGLYDADLDGSFPKDLDPENYGLSEADMDKEFILGNSLQLGFLNQGAPIKLREIVGRLQQVYTGSIGVEYMHIWDAEQVNWIREQATSPPAPILPICPTHILPVSPTHILPISHTPILPICYTPILVYTAGCFLSIDDQIETPEAHEFTSEEKLRMLDRLCWSDHFEAFLASKYSTAKRFGLEGCESLLVAMEEAIDVSSELGVEASLAQVSHFFHFPICHTLPFVPIHHRVRPAPPNLTSRASSWGCLTAAV